MRLLTCALRIASGLPGAHAGPLESIHRPVVRTLDVILEKARRELVHLAVIVKALAAPPLLLAPRLGAVAFLEVDLRSGTRVGHMSSLLPEVRRA